jgi:hypothetical protein
MIPWEGIYNSDRSPRMLHSRTGTFACDVRSQVRFVTVRERAASARRCGRVAGPVSALMSGTVKIWRKFWVR